jgi:hypothetical protein
MKISNVAALGPSKPKRYPTTIRWPVEEIGINSVTPSTIPKTIASNNSRIFKHPPFWIDYGTHAYVCHLAYGSPEVSPPNEEKVEQRYHAVGSDAIFASIGCKGRGQGKFLGRCVGAHWGPVGSRRLIAAGRLQNLGGLDGVGITTGGHGSGDLGISLPRTVEAAELRPSPKARLTSGFAVR